MTPAFMRWRHYLWVECAALFIALPIALMIIKQRSAIVAALWLTAALVCFLLSRQPGFSLRAEWNAAGLKEGLLPVLKRFGLLAVLIAAFTVAHDFDRLFSFPLEKPRVWAMVMVLYPILSALPQEVIYRTFFFRRYRPLFDGGRRMIIASAAAFAFVHIIFANWIALVFTAAGGCLFSETYAKRRSLALVALEHALYGCFIFTIGLGWYFYGAAWQAAPPS